MALVSREVFMAAFIGAVALVSAAVTFLFIPPDPGDRHIDADNGTAKKSHRTIVHSPRSAASRPH